ncbi:MAG TPA: hydrogen peroxide-inducible genes activator [Bacteroidales bacterium]|nr:hydrogen peroxide-inducible genes activator [Bacteroidales bacterium]
MITLVQLQYLVAIDRHRNFARASEACFVTQPTLSMQVKKLEDELGVVIFDRTKKPVIATEIGRLIIDQAQLVINQTEQIHETIKSFNQNVSGKIRLGIIPTLAPYLLPRFAGNLRRHYPEVQLLVRELLTDEIAERLIADELDAGIFVTPYYNSKIREWPLFYEEMKLYTSPGHAIFTKPLITVRDAEAPGIWLLSDGHCFRDQVINLCDIPAGRDQQTPYEFEGGSLETLMRIIDKEGGFTLMPDLAVLDLPEEKQQQIKTFDDYTPLREVSLVFSRNFAKHRLLQLLFDEIRANVPAYMIDAERGKVVEWKEK